VRVDGQGEAMKLGMDVQVLARLGCRCVLLHLRGLCGATERCPATQAHSWAANKRAIAYYSVHNGFCSF
jgi:hypothetical protein